MTSILQTLNDRVVPAVALENVDVSWSATLDRSATFGFWLALKRALSAALPKLSAAGALMQRLGFVLVALLCFVLAAPQFANDKEGLAAIVGLAFFLHVAGGLLNGPEKFRASAVDALVILFLFANIIAAGASHYLVPSMSGLSKLLVFVISYFLFVGVLQQSPDKRIPIILAMLTMGGLLVSLYGLYQYKIGVAPLATWEDPTVEEKATRIYSTLGNPNLLAGYLVPLIPVSFCLSMVVSVRRGWTRFLVVPLLAVTGIIAAATFLTGSRGGYIGIIAALGALFAIALAWLWREKVRARVPLIICAVLLPLAAVAILHFKLPSVEHRFLSIFAGSQHSSNAYRMNVWRSSWHMFQDNWWCGVGPGNKTFRLAYGLYMRSGFDALGTYCVPLEVAVESGIPGLLSFSWLVLACCARAHRRFWGNSSAARRWLAAGAMAALIGMMFHGLVDTVFYRPQVQLIFWLMVAVLVAMPASNSQDAAQ